jgi:hypothetical protein
VPELALARSRRSPRVVGPEGVAPDARPAQWSRCRRRRCALSALDAKWLQRHGIAGAADQRVSTHVDQDRGACGRAHMSAGERAWPQHPGWREYLPNDYATRRKANIDADLGERADIVFLAVGSPKVQLSRFVEPTMKPTPPDSPHVKVPTLTPLCARRSCEHQRAHQQERRARRTAHSPECHRHLLVKTQ